MATDPSRCVVCGEPNDCALAREDEGEAKGEGGDEGADASTPCWCVDETFPKPLVAWLAEEKGAKRCLCRRCLARHRAGDSVWGGAP